MVVSVGAPDPGYSLTHPFLGLGSKLAGNREDCDISIHPGGHSIKNSQLRLTSWKSVDCGRPIIVLFRITIDDAQGLEPDCRIVQVRPVYGHGYSVARYGMNFYLAVSLRQFGPKDRLHPMLRELVFDEDGEARVNLPRYSSQRLDR